MMNFKKMINYVIISLILIGCDNQEAISSRNDTIIKVEKPSFNLSSGEYNSDIEVEITCATVGATIYYTIDGTTPDDTSNLYSSPINIGGNRTSVNLTAIAIKEGFDNSDLCVSEFNINYLELNAYSYLYYGSNQQQIIKVDLESGNITNIGSEKNFGTNRRGFFINELTNELVWIYYDSSSTLTISTTNLTTDTVTTKPLNLPIDKQMSSIYVDSNYNVYSYLYYGSNQQQIIKVDLESGNITNIGSEKNFGTNCRGFFINELTNELVWTYYDSSSTLTISTTNLTTDTVTTKPLILPVDKQMSSIYVDSNYNVYSYLYYGSNQQQIIKVDLESGNITNIGSEKNFGTNCRGFFINELTNELVWIYYDSSSTPYISTINLTTDAVTTNSMTLTVDTQMSEVFIY